MYDVNELCTVHIHMICGKEMMAKEQVAIHEVSAYYMYADLKFCQFLLSWTMQLDTCKCSLFLLITVKSPINTEVLWNNPFDKNNKKTNKL